MTIDLYRCPGLLAWITKRQCKHNAGRARAAYRSGAGSAGWTEAALVREVCHGCPGVTKLGAGHREFPNRTRIGSPRRWRRLSGKIGPTEQARLQEHRRQRELTTSDSEHAE